MARAIWTGSLTFGLVNIPVGLFSATEDHSTHFHQFQRGTADRVRYQRINERTGDKLTAADIVKGAEVDGGYVVVETEELEKIAPGRSRSLEITGFVDLNQIDPLYFQKGYYLGPQGDNYQRTYALLLAALEKTNRAGIASLVMRGKEYLTAIRAKDEVMALHTLFFADEVRNPVTLFDAPEETPKFKKQELAMATQLVEALDIDWEPEQYRDTYRERVQKLLKNKAKGKTIVPEEAAPQGTNVIDLMEALQRSVDAAGGKKTKTSKSGKTSKTSGTSRRKSA